MSKKTYRILKIFRVTLILSIISISKKLKLLMNYVLILISVPHLEMFINHILSF